MQQARRIIPKDLCQPGQKNRVSLVESTSIPVDILAKIRAMVPPYNFFFSIEESSCQAVIPTLDTQTGETIQPDEEEAPVYTLTLRQDDVEKGVPLGQQLEKVAQGSNEKMVYLYLLDTFSYLLRSIQLLKDTGLFVKELSDHTITFQSEASVFLISLYGNTQLKADIESGPTNDKSTVNEKGPTNEKSPSMETGKSIEKGYMWERTLLTLLQKEGESMPTVNFQERWKDFMGGSPHSLFLSNQLADSKDKVYEYYSKHLEMKDDQAQPDYASWKSKCLETVPLWETYELVVYFFDFVDKHKELLPSYRQPFFNLLKEFLVAAMSETRMDAITFQKRVQNEMVKVRLLLVVAEVE